MVRWFTHRDQRRRQLRRIVVDGLCSSLGCTGPRQTTGYARNPQCEGGRGSISGAEPQGEGNTVWLSSTSTVYRLSSTVHECHIFTSLLLGTDWGQLLLRDIIDRLRLLLIVGVGIGCTCMGLCLCLRLLSTTKLLASQCRPFYLQLFSSIALPVT